MALIEGVTNIVAEQPTVAGSVTLLVGRLAGLILDNLGNREALKQLADELLASQGALATAVAVGTAAEKEKPVDPPKDKAKGKDHGKDDPDDQAHEHAARRGETAGKPADR